jgi:hypothetical protein
MILVNCHGLRTFPQSFPHLRVLDVSYSSLAIAKEQLIPRCPKLEVLLAAPGTTPVFNGMAQSAVRASICVSFLTSFLSLQMVAVV